MDYLMIQREKADNPELKTIPETTDISKVISGGTAASKEMTAEAIKILGRTNKPKGWAGQWYVLHIACENRYLFANTACYSSGYILILIQDHANSILHAGC
jgi:hypothetical protein